MSKPLFVFNALLVVAACLLVAATVREVATPRPLPPPAVLRATPAVPSAAAEATAAEGSGPELVSGGGYGVIAVKNPFSPTRSEAAGGPAVAVGPKPFLHGVVVDGPRSRAFLEDPTVKRTFGYAVGDSIGGGQVQAIKADRVVIARPDGLVEILLQDPAKPRPGPVGQAPGPAPPLGVPRPPAPAVPLTTMPAATGPMGMPPGANPGR